MIEGIKKINEVKIVEILFYSFPFSFIIGNLLLSLNLFLFIITALLLIKKKQLIVRLKSAHWILITFFLYIILTTSIQFLKPGILNDVLQYTTIIPLYGSPPIDSNAVLKSFLLLRFLILILVLDILFINNIINLKKFFLSSLICSCFVSLDIIIQYTVGFDLFGYESLGGKNSGPFGDEIIAGAYLQKFSFFSIFYIFILSLDKNFNKPLVILMLVLHAVAIGLAGNRMPFILFLFGCILTILFIKNIRFIMTTGLLIFLSIFFIITKNDEAIQDQYLRLFQEINNLTVNKFIKVKFQKDLKDNTTKVEATDEKILGKNEIVRKIINKGGGRIDSGHSAIFRSSILVWKEQPFFGFGLKSFRIKCWGVLDRAGNSNIITTSDAIYHKHLYACANHPHNYYLELLSETGLVGLSLLMIFFIIILKNSFYYLKKYNREINSEFVLFLPLTIVFFLEIWPLRSAGSFFTTWTATFFWLLVAPLLTVKNKKLI